MGRTNRYDDEDMRRRRDMREVLRDGEVLRVRMSDGLDPLQRAVAEHVAGGRKTITDGYGFAGEALQRPGFRLSSTANYDSVDAAYDQYDTRLRDAYKDADDSHTSSTEGVGSGGFAGRRVGDLCTVRGRFDVGERATEVPSKELMASFAVSAIVFAVRTLATRAITLRACRISTLRSIAT